MTQVTPMQADKEAAEECAVELLRHAHYDAKIPGSVNTDIIARHIARARADRRRVAEAVRSECAEICAEHRDNITAGMIEGDQETARFLMAHVSGLDLTPIIEGRKS